jgi:tetratricopeptide (TPR) repeat protein
MGKKAKNASGLLKAAQRKVNKAALPPPPVPVEEEVGSAKILDQPTIKGNGFKVIGTEGFDDGGVADLSLLIDLEDNVQRRRRGENEYFRALNADLLPRATKGPMGRMSRREQKVSLAQLLFSEAEDSEDKGPSEVYVEQVDGGEDAATMKHRAERVQQARAALRMSLMLREAACTSLSLSELCKRKLTLTGKSGAEEALRCADKALEIAGEGFWDGDDVAIEAEDKPQIDSKYEKNATTPGLANPSVLKLLPLRVSHLCKRSALLQRGNALAAMGDEEGAIKSYEEVFPLVENEPRCARIDWERHSLYVNIGNSHSRKGDFDAADEQYKIAETLGTDHVEGGNTKDGKGMIACAKRARSFALKRAGKVDEAKALMKEVITQQIADNAEEEKQKAEEEAAAKAAAEKAKEEAEAAPASN